MKKILAAACALWLMTGTNAEAHFGMVIPSRDSVMDKKEAVIDIDFAFAHPFEGKGMDFEVEKAQIFVDGKPVDILPSLKPVSKMGKKAYRTSYKLTRPGVYTLTMTPRAYWEPAENKYIIHYTKTVVAAFGEEEGWSEPVGLPIEIVPLTRPFATYAGSVFRGQVLNQGKPAEGVNVEVEYLNGSGEKYKAPNDYFVTQVVRTDANGVFAYAAPFAGWWGFAALADGPDRISFEGKDRDVEIGGVFWAYFTKPEKQK